MCGLQLASPTWDVQARERRAAGIEKDGAKGDNTFSMVRADFHDHIRVLAPESLGFISRGSSGTLI